MNEISIYEDDIKNHVMSDDDNQHHKDTRLSSPVSSRSYNSGTVVCSIAMFGVKLDDSMVVRSFMREIWL